MKTLRQILLAAAAVVCLASTASAQVEQLGTFRSTAVLSATNADVGATGAYVNTFSDRVLSSTDAPAVGCRLYLNVTLASGSNPTLDIVLQTSLGGVVYQLTNFTQATAVSKQVLLLDQCPVNLRAVSTIGGSTPRFSYSVAVARY